MELQQVAYRLFEREVGQDWVEEARWHQLDGEVMLVGASGAEFITWCSEPAQYSIGRSSSSSFTPEILRNVDLSSHPIWRALIGREVSMRFVDEMHQVLQIEGAEHSVFLSSQYDDGAFLGDCVRVSTSNPL